MKPQSPGSDPKRWALLLGVDGYGEGWSRLSGCAAAAETLGEALVATRGAGYGASTLCLLAGPHGDAVPTRDNLLASFDRLIQQTRPGDSWLFYFAGLATLAGGGEILLLPVNARPGRFLAHTAVPLSDVLVLFQGPDAPPCLVMLDLVYQTEEARAGPAQSEDLESEIADRVANLHRQVAGDSAVAILHTAGSCRASGQPPHEAACTLARRLIRALRTPFPQRGGAQEVTTCELYERMRVEMGQPGTGDEGGAALVVLVGSGSAPVLSLPEEDRNLAPFGPTEAEHGLLLGDALLAPLRSPLGFVGRREELRRALQLLTTTTDMALLAKGEPGVGKTSFLNQVKAALRDLGGNGRVYLDLSIEPSSVNSLQDFARELWCGLINAPDVPAAASLPFALDTFGGFGASLNKLSELAPNAVFVAFVDEFDQIHRNCTELEQRQIRGLINYLVVSTSFPIVFFFSVIEDLPPHYGSAVPTVPLILHTLSRDEMTEALRALLPGVRDLPLEWLYERTGGHPYLIRLLLAKLGEQLGRRAGGDVPFSLWQSALGGAVASGHARDLFTQLFESYLDDSQRYVLLWFAANAANVMTADVVARMSGRVRSGLRQLVERDYLSSQADGSYRLRIGLLRDWLPTWSDFDLELERLHVVDPARTAGRPAAPSGRPIPLEGVCVDLLTGDVYVDGAPTREVLTDQQYRALVYLTERVGEIVSDDALAEHLWPGEAHEVDDQRIAQVIHRIRVALNDRQKPYRYLETLPKRGYRLHNSQAIRSSGNSLRP